MENYKLGRQVLNQIESDPDSFDMTTWAYRSREHACGTVACLAGHTMLQSGYPHEDSTGLFFRPDGSIVPGGYGEEAARLLGLNPGEVQAEGGVELWFDLTGGYDRFKGLVEYAEAQARTEV